MKIKVVFYEDIKKHIEAKASEIKNEVISFRRHIHKYPELSFNEIETSLFICSVLEKYNIRYKSGISGHGIVAVIECNNPNSKVLGLRADMDALPIKEENNVSYKSVNDGVMHACGHDVHSAIALGVCIVINEIKDKLNGTIKIIFQPAEEKLPGGAIQMINDGVLNNPKVEKMLALHVLPEMEIGNVGFRGGKYMAACDEIYIEVNGKGGHAALPDQVINPIIVAANLMIKIKKSVSLIDSDDKYVLEFGDFHAFGASNVIPNHANISGTFRSLDQKFRSEVHELILKEAQLIDLKYNSNCVVKIKKGYPVLFNDNDLTSYCEKKSKFFLGKSKVHELEIRMASEDFSHFSNEVPSCFFRLGVGNKKKNITSSVHTPTFNIDENCMEIGVGLMSFLLCTNLQDQKKV